MKPISEFAAKMKSFFFTGVKEHEWNNVQSEIETAEGGAWFTSGDNHMTEYKSKWF